VSFSLYFRGQRVPISFASWHGPALPDCSLKQLTDDWKRPFGVTVNFRDRRIASLARRVTRMCKTFRQDTIRLSPTTLSKTEDIPLIESLPLRSSRRLVVSSDHVVATLSFENSLFIDTENLRLRDESVGPSDASASESDP